MEFGFAAFKSGVSLRHPGGDSQRMTDGDSGLRMETGTEV